MKVNINNQHMRVRWSHYGIYDHPVDRAAGTNCEIVAEIDGKDRLLTTGRAFVYFKDKQFNKNLGRKASLTKALDQAFPGIERKAIRAEFWNQYYIMRNNKW